MNTLNYRHFTLDELRTEHTYLKECLAECYQHSNNPHLSEMLRKMSELNYISIKKRLDEVKLRAQFKGCNL